MVPWRTLCAVLCLSFWAPTASAGDSLYGRIVEVRSAEVLVIESGTARYVVNLIAIFCPRSQAQPARQFVTNLALGKGARVRIMGFTDPTTINGRILIDDPESIVKDIGTQIVSAGFAPAQTTTAYKYQELETAEKHAMAAQLGMYASQSTAYEGSHVRGYHCHVPAACDCPIGARHRGGLRAD